MKKYLVAAGLVAFTVIALFTPPASAWTMQLSGSTACVNGTSMATFKLSNSTETETMTVRASNHTDLVPVGKTVAGKSSFSTTAVNTPYTLTISVNWPSDKTLRQFSYTAQGITCSTTTTVKPTTTTTIVRTTTTVPCTTSTSTTTVKPTTTTQKITTTTHPVTTTTVPKTTTTVQRVTTSTTSSSTTLPSTSTTTPTPPKTTTSLPVSIASMPNTGANLDTVIPFGFLLVIVGCTVVALSRRLK